MRRRLLAAFIIVAAGTVVVLGVPLAIIGRSAVRNDAVQRVDHEADGIALTVITRLQRGEEVDPALLAPFAIDGHYIEVVTPDGRSVTAGTRPNDDTVDATIASDGTTVRVSVPDGDVDRRQALVVLVVGALGVLAVALAAGVGVALSRRLARPLDELAAAARRLGDGDLSARAAMTGLGEVDAVAATLNKGAAQIEQVVAAERRFSANASHQLRTPLTALRMRLEEIAEIGDVPVRIEAAAALGQADRLDETIDELLRLARDGTAGPTSSVDLAAVVRDAAPEWCNLARRAGRRLEVAALAPCWAIAAPGSVRHVLDVLVDNALRHSATAVTITVTADDAAARLDVTNDGDPVAPDLRDQVFQRGVSAHGSGLGLALANELSDADGGRLSLVSARPAHFRVTYRAGPPDGADSDSAPGASRIGPP